MKKFLATLIFTAAVMVVGTALADELRFGVARESPSIDPHWSTNVIAIGINRNIYDHLINKDDNMDLAPGLAVSWKLLDDLTWEFKLRQGVKWHDGSPFTTDDVVLTFDRAAKLDTPGSFNQYLRGKTPVRIDDHTVHIKTENPQPLVDIDVAAFAIVSKKHAEGAEAPGDFNTGKAAIGTGPYKFVEWKPEDRLVLVANPDYWGGKPKWDKVIFKPIKSDPTRVAALKSGEVDVINNAPTVDVPDLEKDPNIVVSAGQGNRPWYLWMDSRRDIAPDVLDNDGKPIWPNPLRDWKVRKAISKAINRQAIVDRVFEGSAVATSQLLPEGFYGFNEELKVEPYDPEGAKKLLAEAGFPDGFRLTVHGAVGGQPNDAKVIEAVAQMLTQVDLETSVRTYPASTFFSKTAKWEFGFAVRTYSVASGEPSIQLKAVVHTGPIKGTKFCCQPTGMSNPRTDALIEEAIVTIDKDKREQLFKDAIGIAVRDVGIAPLYFQFNTWASRKGLKYITRLDAFDLADNVVKTD